MSDKIVCFYCHEPIMNDEKINDDDTLITLSYEPCPKCMEKGKGGIPLIGVKTEPNYDKQMAIDKNGTKLYPTGNMVFVSEDMLREFYKKEYADEIINKKGCLMDDSDVEKIIELAGWVDEQKSKKSLE